MSPLLSESNDKLIGSLLACPMSNMWIKWHVIISINWIGVVFGALILGVARNPSLKGQLFSYAILGFAFSEATGLFALMMAFLLLYVA